jgi:hypothetical protein
VAAEFCVHGDYIEGAGNAICAELLADDAWLAREYSVVIFEAPDGRKWLRGLLKPTPFRDLDLHAQALGADAWHVLGDFTPSIDGRSVFSDCDYSPEGAIIARRRFVA